MSKLFTTLVCIIIPWHLPPPSHHSNGYNARKNNNNSIQCDDILGDSFNIKHSLFKK